MFRSCLGLDWSGEASHLWLVVWLGSKQSLQISVRSGGRSRYLNRKMSCESRETDLMINGGMLNTCKLDRKWCF
ncbi:unnamed protein product [Camellia sinensis]